MHSGGHSARLSEPGNNMPTRVENDHRPRRYLLSSLA